VAAWFLGSYLKYMPFALTLYLLWIREGARTRRVHPWGEDEDGEEDDGWRERASARAGNIGSLGIALIFYPVIIGWTWKRAMSEAARDHAARVEIRRSKERLFALLSEDELAYAKRLARKGLSLLEVRKELEAAGYTPQHRFAPALAATLLISLVGSLMPRSAEAKVATTEGTVIISAQVEARAGPTFECDSVHHEHSLGHDVEIVGVPALAELVAGSLVDPPAARPTRSRTRTLEHIPINLAA